MPTLEWREAPHPIEHGRWVTTDGRYGASFVGLKLPTCAPVWKLTWTRHGRDMALEVRSLAGARRRAEQIERERKGDVKGDFG